ncbi:hypothetical protein JOB18_003940 [Solea senegalensis]|uniref:Uncharacterized protein n=1 Tax=Solea senegalensis TaxID=28829 RepID=A0AAV6R7M6_SOLSE|nr:hypothetical protein JOB18_003940 [Solea senegalensis]
MLEKKGYKGGSTYMSPAEADIPSSCFCFCKASVSDDISDSSVHWKACRNPGAISKMKLFSTQAQLSPCQDRRSGRRMMCCGSCSPASSHMLLHLSANPVRPASRR